MKVDFKRFKINLAKITLAEHSTGQSHRLIPFSRLANFSRWNSLSRLLSLCDFGRGNDNPNCEHPDDATVVRFNTGDE